MGDAQRIFYYHVPAATVSYTLFLINFIASIVFLQNRSEGADTLGQVDRQTLDIPPVLAAVPAIFVFLDVPINYMRRESASISWQRRKRLTWLPDASEKCYPPLQFDMIW